MIRTAPLWIRINGKFSKPLYAKTAITTQAAGRRVPSAQGGQMDTRGFEPLLALASYGP
jgi:hypothetical protein